MNRSGEKCSGCGYRIPYMVCSHCKPQITSCPHCGEKVLLLYEDPVLAGREILRKVKEKNE